MLAQLYSRHDCLFKVFKNSLRPVIRLGKKTMKLRAWSNLFENGRNESVCDAIKTQASLVLRSARSKGSLVSGSMLLA